MAVGSFTSSACTTHFLHVTFDALRHINVDHTIQILEVQTHPKSDGGDHDLDSSSSKILHQLGLLLHFEPCVKHGGLESRICEEVECISRNLSGPAVHENAFELPHLISIEVVDKRPIYVLISADADAQILRPQTIRLYQLFDFHFLHHRFDSLEICSGRQAQYGLLSFELEMAVDQLVNNEIGGTEVVRQF